ncbi:nucleotidyltransferase family protein [Desulfosporosinus sp. OT]|uniref:nucleotidyltransferase domain-containing protein n=1 Tax=Desulfosporosinus sp. OT TaxID=913865 RepID=UPI000223A92B|nr:nucleotidyltransferase family protein [Desulfosporosinus sp. OT]EGW38461.1 hypothetical protein DOT_3745 [Desulfosporosinus sp. OT]
MNTSQEQLLSLLTLAIHGGVPSYEIFSSIYGEELFDLALQHNVFSFLYPTLNKHCEEIKLDELIMRRWKEATLYMATRQVSMINKIRTIFELFESSGIPVISLKGLVLKGLYPQPELRNMGDIDLLIQENDMQRAIELLGKHGYRPNSKDLNNPKYMHIGMYISGSFPVELHRTLWHPSIMKTKDDHVWLNHMWQNKRLVIMEGLKFTALSLEDEFINLVVHLSRHIMGDGAQLRQLCDFVLFVKIYWNMMDIKYIEHTIEAMELYAFYQHLHTSCHFYLGLTVPTKSDMLKENKSDVLINLIYTSKIHHQTKEELSTFVRYNKLLDPFTSTEKKMGRFLINMKTILKSIPYMKRTYKFFKCSKEKARYLRSVGLYIKY